MPMESVLSFVSLVGAGFSTITTIYYWFVRVRSERPDLKCYLADRELFLGTGSAEARQIGLKLSLVVANDSSLPNAVLGLRLWVKQRDGGWLEADKVLFDKTTPRPFNLPTLQTALLCVSGYLTFPHEKELEAAGGNKTLIAYTERFLSNPREIKVELKGLKDRSHTSVVSYPAAS